MWITIITSKFLYTFEHLPQIHEAIKILRTLEPGRKICTDDARENNVVRRFGF